MTGTSYFEEGLVVILVPATIGTPCLLQENLQRSDLCRKISVWRIGLMEKIVL